MTGFAYWEWSSPEGTDVDDRDAVRAANPAFGTRLNEDFVFGIERVTMDEATFARERLGIFPDPDEAGESPQWAVIPEADWTECRSRESGKRADRPGWLVGAVTLAVEVRPDRSSAVVVAAGDCREGGVGVEVVAAGPSVGWVVAEVVALLADPERPTADGVVVDAGGPAAVLIPALEAAGVRVVELAFADVKQATAEFFDAVVDGDVVHRDRPELNDAVAWAIKRKAGDALLIERKGDHDASPLVGAVLAHHGHLLEPEAAWAAVTFA